MFDSHIFSGEVKKALNAFASYFSKVHPYGSESSYISSEVYLISRRALSYNADMSTFYIFDSSFLTYILDVISMVKVCNHGFVWPFLLHSVHGDTGLVWLMSKVDLLKHCTEHRSVDTPIPKVLVEIDAAFHNIFHYILEMVSHVTPFSTKMKVLSGLPFMDRADNDERTVGTYHQEQLSEVTVTMVINIIGDCVMSVSSGLDVKEDVTSFVGIGKEINTLCHNRPFLKRALVSILGGDVSAVKTVWISESPLGNNECERIFQQLKHHVMYRVELNIFKKLLSYRPEYEFIIETMISVKEEVVEDRSDIPDTRMSIAEFKINFESSTASVPQQSKQKDNILISELERKSPDSKDSSLVRYFAQRQRCPACCMSFKRGHKKMSYLYHHANICHPELCPRIFSVIKKKYPF